MSAIDPGHEEGIKEAGNEIESEASARELEEENEVCWHHDISRPDHDCFFQ